MRLLQPNRTKLDITRRHRGSCPRKDPQDMRCECPLQVSRWLRGKPLRYTALGTSDMAEAARQMALMQDPDTPSLKAITEAVEAYQKHGQSLAKVTQRRYSNVLTPLLQYSAGKKFKYVTELTVDVLDDFRATRQIAPRTSAKELVILRMFLNFALERKWIAENPAKQIRPPKNIKPPEIVPYTRDEIVCMLAACEVVGNSRYERQRARAMLLLLRATALRISDAATFSRDRVRNGRIFLRTTKTGGLVFIPMPPELQKELDALPVPRRARANSRYYFWNETSARKTVIANMARTLRAVFKHSGVKKAHPHKFRHTLATELLAKGRTTKDVADILGISEAVVTLHYAKWSEARQDRIDQVMNEFHADIFGAQPPASKKTVN